MRDRDAAVKDDRRMLHDPQAIELDPHLLSTPFEVQTNWHVITGAACSGKTTLIDLLADKGFQTVAECARQVIEGEVTRGRTLDEIFENGAALEPVLADAQIRIERELRATDIVFLDRGLPDCLFFFRIFGLNPNQILAECFHHRYASVFILDLLPLELDGARIEDEAYTVLLDEWLVRDYSAPGI
jgi:predicted ATPase